MDNSNSLVSIRLNGKDSAVRSAGQMAESQALGRADRLANVGQLAAGLAHEMNTPLGSISAHAEESLDLLEHLRDGSLERRQLDDLRGRLLAIMRQANRCSRIATRLLQFAQPGRPVAFQCRTEQVVDQVVELFTPPAREKGIHIGRHLEPDLPDAPVGPAELEQLLVNLVQNSLDACGRGDLIRIEVRVHPHEERKEAATSSEPRSLGGDTPKSALVLVVSDTGCGIPSETLGRIFDPFFTTKPVGQGTGLGLSVCHGIVRSVGGSIEVESAPGQGTRVIILLPLESNSGPAIRVHEACPLGTRRLAARLEQ